ncbi:hypothetical protein [Nocardia sp. NPDC052566]|uniref:hypothetical protein n=1 Tax=Nocardia sp. NPDC052566 TaxID=3364330 RepID=UPI0037C8B2D4
MRMLDRDRVAVVCALTGMRGVGKTQVAAAYARARIDAGCGAVGWVNAETYDELTKGLAEFAEELGVADPDGDTTKSAQRLTRHLATRRGDALLVFDNAVDPAPVLRFLPATGAQVVITSTERSFTQLGEPLDIDRYVRPESRSYLRTRTTLDDEKGANAVAEELGDLPLALASAAATIELRGLHYQSYLELLRDDTVADFMPHRDGQHYPYSTAAALVLNLRTVVGGEPTTLCGRLLGVIALLSAEGVTREFLHGLAAFGSDFDVAAIEQALERCVAGSILTWSHKRDAVIMHRLMARVVVEQARSDVYFRSLALATLDLIQSRQFDRADGWRRRHEGLQLVLHSEALWQALCENGLT